MNDIHWTSYVGMASGIVGVFIASISLYKTNRIKSLDLRLEFKRIALDITSLHEELDTILIVSLKSRTQTAAALSMSGSGGTKSWLEEHANDTKLWKNLGDTLPDTKESYNSLSKEKLEGKLVKAYGLKIKLNSLKEKYASSLAKDEKDSKFLREQSHRNVR
jgi:hypothetical protein